MDDDFKETEGAIDKLFGVILKKFGDTPKMIKAKFDTRHLK